jgi:SOUL heme-binding protein
MKTNKVNTQTLQCKRTNRREKKTMGNSSSTSLPSAGVMTSSLLYDHPPKTELPYDTLPHELQGYFELRLYPAHCACQVSGPVGVPMTTVMASSSGSRMPVLDLGTANSVLEKFRILARYHGAVKNTNPANYSKRPIEMVAPITVGYQTRFVTSPAAYTSTVVAGMVFGPGMQEFVTAPLPEFASLSELPVPLEPSIVLGVVPARVIAVLPFSGIYHSPDEVQRPLQLLRSQLVAAGLLGPHDGTSCGSRSRTATPRSKRCSPAPGVWRRVVGLSRLSHRRHRCHRLHHDYITNREIDFGQ